MVSLAKPVFLAVAVTVLLAGCATPSTGAATSSTSPPPTDAAAVSTCVADPQAVIARTSPLPGTAMPDALATTLDQAAQSAFTAAAAPGAIVAVQSPQGTFLKAYGVADPTTGAPMTTDMFQRIGSVTKTFTGTEILKLAAASKLSLDDPISKYVAGVTNGDSVTLRMLTSMTSGISSYTLDPGWHSTYFSQPDKVWTPDQLLAIGLALPPKFAPGAGFDYSNTNTILLGKVIEQVAGMPYEDAITHDILDPLGMKNTSLPGQSAAYPAPHPQGFTLQGDTATPADPANATDWNPSWGWSAGAMISTASDLLVYARAQATGNGLLPASAQLERLTSFPGSAGYGIGLGCADGWVGHTGELPGFNTSMFYDTASDTTVVTMTNSDIPSGGCTQSPTLLDNPADLPCSSPATRIFVGISGALGHPFTPPAAK